MADRLSRILGRKSVQEDDTIIPDDAKPYVDREERERGSALANKLTGTSVKEPLIDPEVALVAPDATPRATVRLSPSQVPAGREAPTEAPSAVTPPSTGQPSPNAVMAILGRSRADNSATPSVLPGIPPMESLGEGGEPGAITESSGAALAAATTPGGGMPPPTSGTGAEINAAFRRFGGPRSTNG